MSNRGGKRENAGRPRGQGKYGEPTVTVRIPQSQGATVKSFLDAYHSKRTENDLEAVKVDEFFTPVINEQPIRLPLFSTKVAAGFPSPADDYVEKRLDISEFIIYDRSRRFNVLRYYQGRVDDRCRFASGR